MTARAWLELALFAAVVFYIDAAVLVLRERRKLRRLRAEVEVERERRHRRVAAETAAAPTEIDGDKVPADLVLAISHMAKNERTVENLIFVWGRLFGSEPDLSRPIGEIAEEIQLAMAAQYGREASR